MIILGRIILKCFLKYRKGEGHSPCCSRWKKVSYFRTFELTFFTLEKATVTEELEIISKPVKQLMNEQKFQYLTRDPENITGHGFLRDKY